MFTSLHVEEGPVEISNGIEIWKPENDAIIMFGFCQMKAYLSSYVQHHTTTAREGV